MCASGIRSGVDSTYARLSFNRQCWRMSANPSDRSCFARTASVNYDFTVPFKSVQQDLVVQEQ
jgi:hypothetical protein